MRKNIRLKKLAEAVEEKGDVREENSGSYAPDLTLPRKEIKSFEEIALTKKIEIPVCDTKPINGRIFVIETDAKETKTAAGIIIPHKMKDKKDETMKNIQRYFVVDWALDIPQDIQNRLRVGIEVNPFLPQQAEEWNLPIVIDWNTGNKFTVIHYTELAGISYNLPIKV